MFRTSVCAALAAWLVCAGAPPAAAQEGTFVDVPVVGAGGTVSPGQRLRGRADNGRLAFRFTGRAGERVTFELESDAPKAVTMMISQQVSAWALTAPPPVVVVSGRSQIATGILPRDADYYVTLTETSFFAKPFTYALTFTSDQAAGKVAGGDQPVLSAGVQAAAAPVAALAAASAPRASAAPGVTAPPPAPRADLVPAHCRQQACWGGMDQAEGTSFSRFDITIPQTERIYFDWVEPGRVMQMRKNSLGNNYDHRFVLDPATGAPQGYTVLQDGALASIVPDPKQGATRLIYRFSGDRFEERIEEFKNGQWRAARSLGMRLGFSYKSEASVKQAREDRGRMFGALLQGATTIGTAALQAQSEQNQRQAELNTLALAAQRETQEREERRQREAEAERQAQLQAQADAQQQAQARQQGLQREQAAQQQAAAEAAERAAQQRAAEQRLAQQRAEQERAAQARAAEQARLAEQKERDREAEARRQAERQSRMADNTSGDYSTTGLPPVERLGSPGSGETTLNVTHIGGCKASGATVRYRLGLTTGEPLVAGSFSWRGEEGCSLPPSADAWVKVQYGSAYGWVPLDPAAPRANGGFGINSPGSPNWNELLCGFDGGSRTGCMDSESARRLWTHGRVTEVRLGW